MELTTSYQYKAINEASYNSLAAYASTIPATVTLHPGLLTIVISENATKEVGKFIDDNGLDFHINQIEVDDDNLRDVIDSETTDADTLREVIRMIMARPAADDTADLRAEIKTLTGRKDFLEKDRDMYQKWYREGEAKAGRVRKQVEAISTLLSSIYPQG